MVMNKMPNWVEKAPSTFVAHQRYSRFSKLETIMEEAAPSHAFQVLPKRILLLLPFFLSFGSYFVLYKHL